MPQRIPGRVARCLSLLVGAALVAVHFWIFAAFFPNENGRLGVDYGYFLPHLLDGEYWRQANGWAAVPWFTPSFCGGLPKFPNPQALYYSAPQLLTFVAGPLSAVRLTLLLFAGLGYWGFYLLGRRLFGFPRATAVLCAALFLFNSLFSARMMVGHLTFHSFMLVPFVPLLLLTRAGGSPAAGATRAVGAACVLAYVASHAIAHVLLQALLITLLVALLQGAFAPERLSWRRFWLRSALAAPLAVALCAAKLAAMASHLEQLPRTLYSLPGIAEPLDLLQVVFLSVFLEPHDALLERAIVNSDWALTRHEFEFGVTAVPLYLVGAAFVVQGSRLLGPDAWRRLRGRRGAHLAGAVLVLVLPLAMNFYRPGWNALLESLPVIASSSSLFRWWSVYIPAAILLTGAILERAGPLRDLRPWVAALGVAGCIGLTLATDRGYYRLQSYDPGPVERAFDASRQAARPHRIRAIGIGRDGRHGSLAVGRNNPMTSGISPLNCYETLFGFRQERFPRGALREGSALEVRDGVFNLKDPSCYVFPEANRCAPGAAIPASRRRDAEAFLAHRPFPFAMPRSQRVANGLSVASLVAVGTFLLAVGITRAVARIRGRG